jgi:adenosylcobyric acid synthase
VVLDRAPRERGEGSLRVVVLRLARIANFDDLDPLRVEPDVALTFLNPGEAVPGDADLVILPGSKATLADLVDLRAAGWDIDIRAHVRRGGTVLGLCGGYQMLGTEIADPEGIEGRPGFAPGLGLLDVKTLLKGPKVLTEAAGIDLTSGRFVHGYEMHMGRTEGPGCRRPMLRLGGRDEGAVSADGRVMGCYLHGLFAADEFRRAFLERLGRRLADGIAYEADVERMLDRLADHLAGHLDLDGLLAAAAAVNP